jgi:hypothetical protein
MRQVEVIVGTSNRILDRGVLHQHHMRIMAINQQLTASLVVS